MGFGQKKSSACYISRLAPSATIFLLQNRAHSVSPEKSLLYRLNRWVLFLSQKSGAALGATKF